MNSREYWAKREAEQIRMEAEQKARQMVEEEEIVKLAKIRAEEVVQNASAKQGELFQIVNARIDSTVAESELALSKALDEVRTLRYQLSGVAAPAPVAAPVAAQPAVKKSNLVPSGFEMITEEDYMDEDED